MKFLCLCFAGLFSLLAAADSRDFLDSRGDSRGALDSRLPLDSRGALGAQDSRGSFYAQDSRESSSNLAVQNAQNPKDSAPKNAAKTPAQNLQIPQPPLIVEFAVFREAEKICAAAKSRLECLVSTLKPFNNKIYTKKSGSNAKIAVLFYALDAAKKPTYAQNLGAKFCDFFDPFAQKSTTRLSGEGFSYVLDYHFAYSTSRSRAFLSCYFQHGGKIIANTSQAITVIPSDLTLNLALQSAAGAMFRLDSSGESSGKLDSPSPVDSANLAANPAIDSANLAPQDSPAISANRPPQGDVLVLKAKSHQVALNATARTLSGGIDLGFDAALLPAHIRFNRDNGLCAPLGEKISGAALFSRGVLSQNTLQISLSDVASGELEIALSHALDADDRADGKCLSAPSATNEIQAGGIQPNENRAGEIQANKNQLGDIHNVGKIPCSSPVIFKTRVEVVPSAFFAEIDNAGRLIYFNQHTFAPAILHLPTAKITLVALNDRNEALKNFTKDCFGRDVSVGLEDERHRILFLSGNAPDSLLPRDAFLQNSTAQVLRKLAVSGTKDRELTPMDAFASGVLNLNETFLRVAFYEPKTAAAAAHPIYFTKPRIKNDWRIALLRGRIALVKNTNTNASLVANPKIQYEFFCKAPTCRIADIESVLSPRVRLPAAQTRDWYINTAHPKDIKVEESALELGGGLEIVSLGEVVNGVQTLALQAKEKSPEGLKEQGGKERGNFTIKVRQNGLEGDFATFLYFAPSYVNWRENLGTSGEVGF